MEKTNQELSELENRLTLLILPDLTKYDNLQVQELAARIMRLSGRLNHLAYQLLFSLDPAVSQELEE